jgi:general secretion pathway protein G
LIELLLVLVILAILAAVVVPKFTGRTQEAKITTTKTQISSLKSSLDLFEHDNGRYPTSDEGLAALVNNPGDLPNWHKVADSVPNDSFGNPFVYRCPGSNGKDYDIVSFGPDGHEGGNDDITN